jgi:hypothetical protein
MANKTTTIIFKAEDRISPALKNATQSVAGLSQSFSGISDAANKSAVQIRAELIKSLKEAEAQLKALSTQKLTPEVQLKQGQVLGQISAIKAQLKEVDKLIAKPEVSVEFDKSKLSNAIAEIKTGISREIGANIAQGLSQIPTAIAATTLQFEKLQTVLKTTLGSKGEADKAFTLIKSFAATTPFQVSEITDSFIKLSNRGITPTRELLTQLGDLASSQGKKFDQITEAILDASTGEFERLKEFGIQASKSGDEVSLSFKGVTKTIANTPTAINAAVASLGDLKGVSGGMEAQSKTLGGALSNLQDTADTLSVAFGQELVPILLEIVKGFSTSGASAEDFARGAGQNVGNAIKFLVDNADKLKLVLELVVIQFALVKAQAAGAAISTLASGAAALAAAGGFTALATAATASALAIAATVAPLALAFAGFKAIETIRATKDMEKLNEVLDINAGVAQSSGNETFKLANKLKSLSEARKNGTVDLAKEKGYLDIAKKQLATVEGLKKEQESLAAIASDPSQKQSALNIAKGYEIEAKALSGQISTLEKIKTTKVESAKVAIRSEKSVEEAVKSRIATEKNAQDSLAKNRQRDFANEVKTDSRAFDSQAQTDKKAFEKTINEEKRVFEAGQKTEKAAFEKGLQAEQKAFNQTEKQSDQSYQKSKQADERVFSQAQQAQKAAFDKSQQDASRAFDAKQNTDKKTADDQFALKRIAIERQLQLDAAKTPEDRTKLEAEFKASDEKAAKEKLAFSALLAEQDAFNKKQQADKLIFDEAQKAAQKALDLEQQTAKLAFDDEIKLKDQAYELQKNEAKLAFEDTLKVKKDALEATQSAAKLVAEDAIAVKKQAFDDTEKVKKDAFEDSLNVKKTAFEDSERVKKQEFEASLKQLEAQFNADERAKDIASAQQVASIKGAASLNTAPKVALAGLGIGVSPRAKGGRFDQGQQLLVGEQGAEIITFGSSGFVSTAADSKQILSSNQAPNVVNTAKLEQLMGAMVAQMGGVASKLDRPNVAITSEKDPNRVLAEVYRSAAVKALDRTGA